jgi:rubrerythrin
MESEWITCMQCDTEFEFDIAEQVRYAEKGYDAPQRCPECRKHKTKFLNGRGQGSSKNRRRNFRSLEEQLY